MKVLISGGAGFIGSHLVESMLADGYDVTVLDNFSTGRKENLAHLKSDRLKIYEEDISNFSGIKSYFESIDWVFHIAALADIVPSIENPIGYHNSNVNGTISVLEAARKAQVKRFIYTASSSC